MNKSYVVYVHINKTNGKRYYGITSMKPEQRWRNGKGYPENEHFTSAIDEYGWDGFDHIIVARGLTENEAKWLEIEMIREFDTTNRVNGYNKTKGGESWNGFRHTQESKKKISEALKGRVFTEEHKRNLSKAGKGRTHSEESKQKMREAQRGEKHHNYGKTRPESTKQKIRGKNNGRALSVICITTKHIFFTAKEGADFYSLDKSGVVKACKGKYKSCGKYNGQPLKWKYVNYKHNKTYRVA